MRRFPALAALSMFATAAVVTAAPAGAAPLPQEQQTVAASTATQATPAAAAPAATGDYYSYCEEGSSGRMVWTNNAPSNCYGWYYEYLDGNQVSKVNMLQLKAADPGLSGQQEQVLIDWCNANGFYCFLATSFLPTPIQAGKYLVGLLRAA